MVKPPRSRKFEGNNHSYDVKQQRIRLYFETESGTDKWSFEHKYNEIGYRNIAGFDEAGRGTLCGPVVAAAVMLAPDSDLPGVDDSKKLSAKTRSILFDLIRTRARAWSVGLAHNTEIDTLNILEATRLAMQRALARLKTKPDLLLTDAVDLPAPGIPYQAIIHGDSLSISIAAASIIAKVTRDRIMTAYHRQFPVYALNRNKGYGTRHHLDALDQYGPCPIHRKTFKGVREFFEQPHF